MADKINIDLLVNAANSAKSIGELKKSFKELKSSINDVQGSDFKKLSDSLNDVEGKLGDMNDAAKTLSGSGVERLNSSFGLFQEGLTSFDTGKIQAGFKGLGAAMDAIPIFLVIEGLKLLWDNFDKVSEVVKQVVGGFSDEEIAVKKATAAMELQKVATSALVREYDREIALLEASGASEEEILFIKKKKIQAQIDEAKASLANQESIIMEIKANDDLSESLSKASAWIQRKLGNDKVAELYEQAASVEKLERIKEEETKRKEAAETIKDLENSLDVLDAEYTGRKTERWKESQEEKTKIAEEETKIAEEEGEKRYQAWKAEQERMANEEAILIPEQKEAIVKTELEIEAEKNAELLNMSALKYEKDKKQRELDKQAKVKEYQEDLVMAQSSAQIAQGLSDTLFSIKMANVKKGSKEEEKAAREQFKINKALSISTAVMQGAQSVLAITAVPDFTLGIASALRIAGVAATTAATVAKISATQFQAASPSSASSSIGSGGGVGSGPTAQFQAPTFFGLGQVTGGNDQRVAGPQRVYVTEGDISKVQNRVSVIESRARIS